MNKVKKTGVADFANTPSNQPFNVKPRPSEKTKSEFINVRRGQPATVKTVKRGSRGK
jgi:hypothetical protein